MEKYVYIGLGGFLGAISRFALGNFISEHGIGFPGATFSINVIGSFLLGFILKLFLEGNLTNAKLKNFITVGFLSSFTTFSTFSYETLVLIQEQKIFMAAAYSTGSLIFGVVACGIGVWIGSKKPRINKSSERGE